MRFVAVALVLFACGTPPQPSEVPPVERITTLPAGVVPDVASINAEAVRKSDPSAFACGQATCATGTQTCCAGSRGAECRLSEEAGPHEKIGLFDAQISACSSALSAKSDWLVDISRCDESIDCGKSAICCKQFLSDSGHNERPANQWKLCKPMPNNGTTPCEHSEVCVEGSPCRLPGTWCRRGECVKELSALTCDGLKCKSRESCCGKPLTCKPDAECKDGEPSITCTRPGDCLSGQQCAFQAFELFASCGNSLDFVTPGWLEASGVSLACDTDSDCQAAKCAGPPPKRMRCKRTGVDWIKACACP